jgi:hypothetical protein
VGESIPEAVGSALAQSDLLLLGFSEAALASRWVSRELNTFVMQAMRDGRPILPCRFDKSGPPTLLADLKYADFSVNFDEGMAALLGAVGVAEEVALQRRVEEAAERLEPRMTEGHRASFYEMFLGDGGDGPLTTTSDSYDNRLSRADRRCFDVMHELGFFSQDSGWKSHSWIRGNLPEFRERDDGDWRKYQWLVLYLSPLGRRVLRRWQPKPKPSSRG